MQKLKTYWPVVFVMAFCIGFIIPDFITMMGRTIYELFITMVCVITATLLSLMVINSKSD